MEMLAVIRQAKGFKQVYICAQLVLYVPQAVQGVYRVFVFRKELVGFVFHLKGKAFVFAFA